LWGGKDKDKAACEMLITGTSEDESGRQIGNADKIEFNPMGE